MKKKVFKFENYHFNPTSGVVLFDYSLNQIKFREKLILPQPIKKLSGAKKIAFDKALFNLFLIAGISYYKIYCPKIIDLGKYKLTRQQSNFWNKVYTKGLGEFFYMNKINFRGLINFPFAKSHQVYSTKIKTGHKNLVPVGGGKDSIVTIELLKKKKENFDLFSLRELKIIRQVAQVAGKKLLVVDRKIDLSLLKLNNKKGVYNGHIPFSAYLAFLTVVTAILYNYKNIVLSNEKTASYGNLEYLGQKINHQWSKSAEFEKNFQIYVKKFITPNIKYYSLLRNWGELDIGREFVKHKKYFPVFSSCNKNFKLKSKNNKRWCGECPKCVFTWAILSAYLPQKELINIFGKNLYKNKKIQTIFDQLLGQGAHKPFECVGTPKEMEQAMKMAIKNKKILILGFAREGFSTYKYLRKQNKEQLLIIADAKKINEFDKKYRKILKKDEYLKFTLGKNYLKNLEKYDLIVKTAGIKLNKQLIKKLKNNNVEITTNLNLFLENIKGYIIGITGSKGKSTTANLIYKILNASRKKVVLVGNIGKPFLDYLSQDSQQTIFVAELSSYQLDTLNNNKIDIGVITSLFPEHLTYHTSLKKYFSAKMKLAKNSKILFYNQNFPVIKNYLKKMGVKGIGFNKPVFKINSSLLGEHNQQNVAAAIKVTRWLKIKPALIKKTVRNFKPLEHRLENVGKYKNIYFYNDVLSTAPESTILAINALKNKNLQTIIVGGFDRGLNYRNLARKIVSEKINNVIYWPNAGEKITDQIKKIGSNFKPNLIKVKNMAQTVKAIYENAPANSSVLLSPAASSYDFYRDYREKGKEFKKLIKKMN